jgi:hypothetical protein
VAYLGILPDLLFTRNQAPLKFGWLTTWWVDKTSDQRLAATMMLFTAMKRYSGRIAISSFTPDAKRVYDATKRFHECARFDPAYFIMAPPPAFRALSTATRWLSRAKNALMSNWKPRGRGLESEIVRSFDENLNSFINQWASDDHLARDSSYWHWIFRHPWVSTTDEDGATQERYEFLAFAKSFEQLPVVIRRHGTIIAFLVLTLRDGRLSLKTAYYDSGDTADVAAALGITFRDIKPWLFVSADDALNLAIRREMPFYFATRRKDPVRAYASFPLSLGTRPQFGIGDNVFT